MSRMVKSLADGRGLLFDTIVDRLIERQKQLESVLTHEGAEAFGEAIIAAGHYQDVADSLLNTAQARVSNAEMAVVHDDVVEAAQGLILSITWTPSYFKTHELETAATSLAEKMAILKNMDLYVY